MKFSKILIAAASILTAVQAAPVENVDDSAQVPEEAIIGYIDFEGASDVAILPFSNSTDSGLMFVNTTIYNEATTAVEGESVEKREAKWHWLSVRPGQPIYKREAEAEAKWHWLSVRPGQPIYKREAEAEAKWHWLSVRPGQPIYKREAEADAEARWHWLSVRPGQPIY
uniref:Mating factor alpha n=1 Tax=Nakaseomyces delphensis TaxID=51657 RepID=Q874L5_NAKDE|nr:mating pheromone alpha2 [Nakaseomyces delphensis]